MKIGDKVRILATGLVGIILDETATEWKVDFMDGEKPVLVKKGTPMEAVGVVPNPSPEPNPRPKKRNLKMTIWTIGIILFIAAAIYVTIANVL
jgi:hypothetical protein